MIVLKLRIMWMTKKELIAENRRLQSLLKLALEIIELNARKCD